MKTSLFGSNTGHCGSGRWEMWEVVIVSETRVGGNKLCQYWGKFQNRVSCKAWKYSLSHWQWSTIGSFVLSNSRNCMFCIGCSCAISDHVLRNVWRLRAWPYVWLLGPTGRDKPALKRLLWARMEEGKVSEGYRDLSSNCLWCIMTSWWISSIQGNH